MTPFDPVALLTILLTFYLPASPENLARARRERPEYFAAGTLGGSHGDKLTLPDGQVWDLIYDVDNATGRRHYQVIQPSDGGDAGDARYPLAPGPLAPIDGTQWPVPSPQAVFAPLVADALSDLHGRDTLLGTAAATLAEASSGAAFDAAVSGAIGDGDSQRAAQLGAVLAATPDDVLAATTNSGDAIAGGEGDAEFTPPPYAAPSGPGGPPDDHAPGDGEHPTPNPS